MEAIAAPSRAAGRGAPQRQNVGTALIEAYAGWGREIAASRYRRRRSRCQPRSHRQQAREALAPGIQTEPMPLLALPQAQAPLSVVSARLPNAL